MTASSNLSPAFIKKKFYVKSVFKVGYLAVNNGYLPKFMANFGYTYKDTMTG